MRLTWGDILDSGHWDELADKMGFNPWILNEGRAADLLQWVAARERDDG